MLSARGVSKSYKKRLVLSNIDFAIEAGESAVIVGRNGAGKSTMLSIFAGFLRPDAGVVTLNGAYAAFCPQDDRLFEELTVADNLKFWASMTGGSNAWMHKLSGILGVDTFTKKRINQLSGGMKKSVAICCALSGDPSILILDEPFSGLDIFHKNALMQAFGKLRTAGKSIIFSSHSLDEIVALDSKIHTLANGQLSEFAPKALEMGMMSDLLERI